MKCSKCRYKNPEGAKFCMNCGAELDVSKTLRGERRIVTILFSDFKGFTSISEKMDVEEVHEIVGKVFKLFEPLIEESGGWLDKYIGDAVMAVFGIPTSHEDDPERAIHCGIKMQETLAKFNREHRTCLAMRIGINTGEVMAGEITGKGGYTVMGDAVNVAQRLESISKPGKITVGEKTKMLSCGVYEFKELPAQKVKGRKVAIQPYEVIGNIKEARVVTGPLTCPRRPIVAREKEVALMKEAFLEVVGDRQAGTLPFRIILISGEPGTGKTRLFEEFKEWVTGRMQSRPVTVRNGYAPTIPVRIREGRCIAYGGSPLWPIGELIRNEYQISSDTPLESAREKLFDGLKTHLKVKSKSISSEIDRENIIHLIGAQIGIDFPDARIKFLSPQIRWEEAKRAFRVWIEQLAQESPFVMCIEDVHWSDSASIELIEELVKYWRDFGVSSNGTQHLSLVSRIIIILLARPEFLERNPKWLREIPGVVHIPLQTLDNIGTRELVERIIGKSDERLNNFVFKETGGNPYYTEELISFLQEKNLIEKVGEAFELRTEIEGVIPDTLRGLLTMRIDMLKPLEKEVLQNASVIGVLFWEKLLSKLIEREIKTELMSLKEKKYISEVPESSFVRDIEHMFKHALLRDAAYTGLTKQERKRIHSLIAEWIAEYAEGELELSALAASHFERGGLIAQAIEWWKKAADRAKKEYHNKEAIGYYDKLLEKLEDREERTKALLDKGSVHELIGEWNIAENHYTEALKIAGKEIFPKAANVMGWLFILKGNYDEAMKYIELSREGFEKMGDKKGMSAAIGNMGIVYYNKGNYDKAMECFEKKLQISEELGDKQGIFLAIGNMGNVYYNKGEYDKAMECYEKHLQIAEELGNKQGIPIAIGNMGNVYYNEGEYDKAMECYEQDFQMAQELGDKQGMSVAIGNMGGVYREKREYDKAMECYEKAISIGRELGTKYYLCSYLQAKAGLLFILDVCNSDPSRFGTGTPLQIISEKIEEVNAVNEEALAIASEIGRKEVIFNARLLRARITGVENVVHHDLHHGVERGICMMESLLKEVVEEEQVAYICYEIWKMNKDDKYRDKANELFKKLYKRTPKIDYLKKGKELENSCVKEVQ